MPPMTATTTSTPLQLEGVSGKKTAIPKKKRTMGQRMIGKRDPDAAMEGTSKDKSRFEGTFKDRY